MNEWENPSAAMGDRSRPLIVAMKGHPGTGKSTLARGAAAALRLPLLDKDDVRDCTLPLQQSPSPSQSQSQTLGGGVGVGAASLNELSYAVLWRVAETQLRLGLSVVVDSPLSRAAHLAALRRAASRCGGARIAIVECRPGRELEWRRRLEERGASASAAEEEEEEGGGGGGGEGWHKPRTWGELRSLVEAYEGRAEYEVGDDVARLVVDTTEEGVAADEMVARVVDFIRSL